MALLEMKYYSEALRQGVTVNVILPERAKGMIGLQGKAPVGEYKTLYLLHGLSDDESIWMRRTSIERYATTYGVAVVMPGVGRSWYTDTAYGEKYFTFITRELPSVCRGYFKGMSERPEDTCVAGLSMGGYGALKAALCCPEVFGACGCLSAAFDITREGREVDLDAWRGIFDMQMQSPAELKGSQHDVYALAEQAERFPRLYIWCGTEDTLLPANRKMRELLENKGVTFAYRESEGNHSWQWWDKHIVDILEYWLHE